MLKKWIYKENYDIKLCKEDPESPGTQITGLNLHLIHLYICILHSMTEKAFLLVYFPVKLLTAWTTVASQVTPGALIELKLPVKMNTGVVSTFDHKLFLINYISSLRQRSTLRDILIDTVNHLSFQDFLQRRVHWPIVVYNWPVYGGILSKL